MARSFDGINDFGSVPLTLSAAPIITLSFWLLWDSYATDEVALEYSDNFNSHFGATSGFIVAPADSGGSFGLAVRLGGGANDYCEARFTRPSAAIWHHYGAVFDLTKSTLKIAPINVDGVSQSISYPRDAAITTATFGDYALNLMSRNGASLFGAGDLAEVAVWRVALSAPELASLAAGVDPLTIQAAALELFIPLNGDTPELDLGPEGHTVTISGASPAADPPALDPPAAPSSLSATAISTTQIDLTWTDNSSNETSFRVERSPNGSTGWASVGTNAADDNTFSNTGLTCGTQYFYRVFAVNGVGDSTASNTANATTSACPPAPSSGGNRMGGSGAIRRPPRTFLHR